MTSQFRKRARSRGITRFELGLGLAALALLGLAAVYLLRPALAADPAAQAQRNAAVIQKAALDWRRDNPNGCPTLSVLLDERQLAPSASVDDPWGRRFRVRCRERDVSVVSPGRDGRPDTDDDVRYPRS